MSTIKAEVRKIADNLKSDATFNEDGSPAFALDAYERNLGEGLTLEARKAFEKNDNNFMCAAALAFGELSTDKMKDNKDLEKTATRVTLGGDKLDLSFTRKSEVSDGKGGRMEVAGSIGVRYRATAHLTAVKKHLRETATAALS